MITRASTADTSTRPSPGRFAIVGAAATIVDVGIAVGLESRGVPRLPADVLALAVAAVVSLRLHGEITLRGDTLDRWIRQPVVFFTVALVAGTVDVAVFLILESVDALWAKLAAVGCAALLRAVFHRAVLFRAVRREQGSPNPRPHAPGGARLSVVIPAYKEQDRISHSIETVRDQLGALHREGDLEIVVVDDGSPDQTTAAALAAGADQVVTQPQNKGKGAAVRAGVAVATGQVIAFTDADLAYAPSQLMMFLEAIESGYDVAIGNRHHTDTETLRGTSALRSFGSRVVNMATNLLLLGNYRDTQCGCKAFRSDSARMVVDSGTIDGFAFDIEILHLVERYGLTMVELPVEVVNSDTSTVKAVRDGIGVLIDILRIRWAARRGRYPAHGRIAPSPSSDDTRRSTNRPPGAS